MTTYAQTAVARMEAITTEMGKLAAHDKMTRSQEQQFLALQQEFNALDHERLRAAVAGGHVERGTSTATDDRTTSTSPVRGKALGMIERHASPLLSDDARERVTRAVETDPTDRAAAYVTRAADPHYARAFSALATDPMNGHRTWNDEELRAFRAVEEMRAALNLNDASGGFLVPFHLDPNVILTNSGAISPLRQVCRVEQITTDVWHGVTSAGVSAEWLAEAAEATDASPTFSQPGIPVHKGAAYVQASLEVAQDARNLDAQLGAMFTDARARKEADAFVLGTGTGQPRGVITALVAAGKTVPSATADTFVGGDVLKLLGAVPARWRTNTVVIAGFPVIGMISQFESGAGARLYPEASEGRILTRRLLEVTGMDEVINATQTNYIAAAFDPASYIIVDRLGSTVVFDPNIRGINRRPTGEVSWTLYWRSGADLVSTDAGRVLDV